MRLEAEAKNSSEKERMRELRAAEMRSVLTVRRGVDEVGGGNAWGEGYRCNWN